jgi:hypothetical protein
MNLAPDGRVRFARSTIFNVDARMTESNRDTLERPLLTPRYIAMVIDVHEPSPASSRSYGVGPVSVPPTDVGSSAAK